MTPSSGAPGATAGATAAEGSRGASTIGRSGRSSIARSRGPSSTRSAAASAEATSSANGLSSRCLRDRSSATAPGSPARQARWYPPTPLTATIRPASSASSAAASGPPPGCSGEPSARSSFSDGPQSGQALGWAWNRRLPGSSYSAWQRAHIRNPAMVVDGRS